MNSFMLSLILVLYLLLLVPVEGYNIQVLPVLQAVGARHVFVVHARTVLNALCAMIAAHYGVPAARIILFFGGRPIQALRRVRDIPGFFDGYTLLMVVRNTAVQVGRNVVHQDFNAAKEAHDVNWGRIAHYDLGNDPNADPVMPDHHENNYILTVSVIWTEDVRGVINLVGMPGGENFNGNILLAILYYYRRKGWPQLREGFLQDVYEQM